LGAFNGIGRSVATTDSFASTEYAEQHAVSPSIIFTYTVTADVSSGDTRAWSETHAPDAPESKRFVREELGDYRSLTKDMIKANYTRRKLARYR